MSKRRAPHPDDWMPHPGPQTRFLSLTCYEAMTGGSAGGGKTDMLLVDAIRHLGKGPGYTGVLFRRTHPELEKHVIPRSYDLYPRLGGRYNANESVWRFPGGERVYLSHLQHDKDKLKFQGGQFQWLGFDELTQFLETQYTYLTSRQRSVGGKIPARVRSATNPGGPGHEWVFDRFAPWLDPRQDGGQVPSGRVIYTGMVGDQEAIVPKGTPGALGRCFVRCGLDDNPSLAADSDYRAILDRLDPLTRAQLRDGNWLAKAGKGLYFKRTWLGSTMWLDERPSKNVVARVRAWDLGATEHGDWTRGVLGSRLVDKTITVEDVASLRGTPGDVQRFILSTAHLDGRGVVIRLPLDPGQAGIDQKLTYARLLQGFRVEWERPTGDKATRFGPFSSQAQAGNVAIVRAPWNESWVQELEAFPEGIHDDQVDATADMFTRLTRAGGAVKRSDEGDAGASRRDMDGWG